MKKPNFTLVELLIVLVILAGLLTVATVSVENLQTKHYADKTVTTGNEIIEALERNEGLSFVSDFGRLPDNVNELKFLFIKSFTDGGGTTHLALSYTLIDPTTPFTTSPPNFSSVSTAYGSPTLGCGWRGAYMDSLGVKWIDHNGDGDDDDIDLQDGWGHSWHIDTTSGKVDGLESWGRDNTDDVVGVDYEWQDEDQSLEVNENKVNSNIDLTVFLSCSDETAINTFTQLTVIYFMPRFATNFASGEVGSVWATCDPSAFGVWSASTYTPLNNHLGAAFVSGTDETIGDNAANPFEIKNLTVGKRKLFVYGTDGANWYASNITTLNLKPGTNNINVVLHIPPPPP